jgi:hypothetical protein
MTRRGEGDISDRIRMIKIGGDPATPGFETGDWVIVDTADCVPSPPGKFVLWEGDVQVVKDLEYVAFSKPPRVVLRHGDKSKDQALIELRICGRVIARLQRVEGAHGLSKRRKDTFLVEAPR